MSEDIQNMAFEVLPEPNADNAVFLEPASAPIQPASDVESPDHSSRRDSEPTEELKAIAKALMVNLAWAMGGLFNKK
ncbi:hypothetical protein [Microcoleus sp. FACHB-672]|uniref:hypothetical protein n=1 Tax=Microcoleus sp. FACHB-672 TaxID=2692825 RepID=UPI001685CE13|nr:hypothetical protein [Microcoleus sp. FACHB-672]MBD2041645.1 hypothetical protein [Microcoleus sp. FACHB-672]